MISAEKLQYPCLVQNKNMSLVMLKVKCSYQLSCFYDRQFAIRQHGVTKMRYVRKGGCLVMMSVRSLQKGQPIESVALLSVWNIAQCSGIHKTLTTKSIFMAADGMSCQQCIFTRHLSIVLEALEKCTLRRDPEDGWDMHWPPPDVDGLL